MFIEHQICIRIVFDHVTLKIEVKRAAEISAFPLQEIRNPINATLASQRLKIKQNKTFYMVLKFNKTNSV